jgi:hypothetical protein
MEASDQYRVATFNLPFYLLPSLPPDTRHLLVTRADGGNNFNALVRIEAGCRV